MTEQQKNQATASSIRKAYMAATIYSPQGRAMTPDISKVAAHFGVRTKTVLKAINEY